VTSARRAALGALSAALALAAPAGAAPAPERATDAVSAPERATASAAPDRAAEAPAPPRSVVGAGAPALGKVVLAGEAGLLFLLPHLTAGVLVGTGAGTSVELRYRNIAAFGHSGRVRLAWGTQVARDLVYGVAVRSSITSLALADGGVIGIQFSNLAIGNDWEIGSDMMLTWLRPGAAHITVAAGPTWTLGGTRYTSFDQSGFRLDPGWRAISASLQGEWELSRRFNVFLRLDGTVLVGTEILPLGYIPTGSVGLGWPL
jgi:hypothetical protein